MEIVNLLEFLNSVNSLYALEYAKSDKNLVNFLDLMTEDEQFTQKIDLGIMYLAPKASNDQYIIVDGLDRLLSLSLLLHAICECYKKTTSQNEKAIQTIRKNYLLNGSKTKLRLAPKEQEVFNKIIFGERLSGKEKDTPMFILLHNFWSQIKEEKLQAASIFKMLKKISVYAVSVEDISIRDLYYTLNKGSQDLDQLLLVENYINNLGLSDSWEEIKAVFGYKPADIKLFFKDFFVTKFSFKEFNHARIYEIFTNYFETMLQYVSKNELISRLKISAQRYNNILNINIDNQNIKKAFINIKIHNGEDTYAYLLNIYEDYEEKNITEATFLEILSTIDEYLRNRLKTPNDVTFNELVQYLNAFITCK